MSVDVMRQKYPFSLPDLPYAYDALEPHFDQKTMQLHHREHHAAYVKKLNEALAKEAALQQLTLAQLLSEAKLPEAVRAAVVNNGGGHLLHDRFWNSLTPAPAKEPQGALAEALNASFGSLAEFRKKFGAAAAAHFACGWVALTVEHASQKLAIEDLKDHTVPRPGDKAVVLILDVWEHAYYLKFQNRRPEFIEAFWKVANWTHAGEIFVNAKSVHEIAGIAARSTAVGKF